MSTIDKIERRVLQELDGWSKDLRDALLEHDATLPADAILSLARSRLTAMLPTIPDPGLLAPQMRMFTIGGAIYVAFYLALRERGWSAERVWGVCERATRLHFERMSGLEKRLASDGMHSWLMKALSRWLAGRSQTEPVGGWVFDYVEATEQHDYGVTYKRCAIRELAIANGAAEFAPYICLADVPGSDLFGWGLERTETLAQGGSRCDFRFKRGAPTKVRVTLPVVPS